MDSERQTESQVPSMPLGLKTWKDGAVTYLDVEGDRGWGLGLRLQGKDEGLGVTSSWPWVISSS